MEEKQGLSFPGGSIVNLSLGRVGVASFHRGTPGIHAKEMSWQLKLPAQRAGLLGKV